jgi:Arc/MetJ-type ribon-helix-helix transcriptional regulator
MRAISIKLTEHLDRQLTALARRRHSNRSAVVRDALEAFAGRTAKPSVTEAAGDLVGSLRGPKDLSTAPRHMAGYGA